MSVGQAAPISPKLPAATQIPRSLDFMVLISCAQTILVHSFRYIFPFAEPEVPGGLYLPESPFTGTVIPSLLEVVRALGLPRQRPAEII
jgi:hypothetical protein